MTKYDDKWEQQINALLDGELGEADAEELKSAASDDRELARNIVEAYQLQQLMDGIGVEAAPASLTKRLKAIPREHKSTSGFRLLQPRWAMAMAVVPLVIVALNMMQPERPSEQEIAKARQELAIAFAYLDRAGRITGRGIESTVENTMSDAVTGTMIRTMKSQYKSSKERKA